MVNFGRAGEEPAPARRLGWLAAVAAVLVAITGDPRPAVASETDQFMAWGVVLADSAGPLNDFVNGEFEEALARINAKDRERPCEAIPNRLYDAAFSSIFSSRLRRFIKKSGLEWYPHREVSYWQYRAASVFRKRTFPVFLPMARTVRIGDVYLGVDKLAHLFGFGRRYHARYQRALRRGRSVNEAQRATVRWGLLVERTYVGGLVDGIVSHGDLEANFQGLRLAREMCEGQDPYLEHAAAGWRLTRRVDLRDYVNPGFDESYNTNTYAFYRWSLVKPILVEEVCPRLDSQAVQGRLARYREIDPGSLSREVIAEYYDKRGERPQRFELERVCGWEVQRADGPEAEVAGPLR